MKRNITIGLLLSQFTLFLYSQPVKRITGVTASYLHAAGSASYFDSCTLGMSGYSMNYRYGTASGLWATQMQKVTRIELSTGQCFDRVPLAHTVKIRRVDNAMVTGNTTVLWMEGDSAAGNINIRPIYEENMEIAFSSGFYNWGTDNLFDNTMPGTNNNNIERFDVIIPGGYTILDKDNEGFALFERGVNGAHDPVMVAGISGLNGLGDPNAYKALPLSVVTADWGDIPGSAVQHVVLRKTPSFTHLLATGIKSQDRGGIYISFASLGFSNGEVVYGYSLMAPDVVITAPSQIINYSNSARFPLTTIEPVGGIDLIGDVDIYRLNNICLLPVEFSFVKATSQQNGVLVQWQTLTEKDNAKFEVEHSLDGIRFETKRTVLPAQNISGPADYSFLHQTPAKGQNYYRIKQVDTDGKYSYSKVVKVSLLDKGGQEAGVFPNPLRSGHLDNIQLKVTQPGTYVVQLINGTGHIIFSQVITTTDGLIEPDSKIKLNNGYYIFRLKHIYTGKVYHNKLIVQ